MIARADARGGHRPEVEHRSDRARGIGRAGSGSRAETSVDMAFIATACALQKPSRSQRRITNLNGSVDVTSAPPLSNVTVENRNGSVSVTVPEQSNFAYQFDATNGDIESDFPQVKSTEQDSRKNTVSGTIGKGGPLLRVTTSQGDVSLKKASIMPLPPLPPMPVQKM